MINVEKSVVINKPVEEVFALVTDGSNRPKQRRREPPIFWTQQQAFTTWIVVKVIHFLFPDFSGKDTDGMLGRLPKPTPTFIICMSLEYIGKRFRQMLGRVIKQLTTGELTHVIQGMFQPVRIEIYIKQDRMEMCRHDYIRIDPQVLMFGTEIQAVRDNSASRFVYEHRQPLNHCEGYII